MELGVLFSVDDDNLNAFARKIYQLKPRCPCVAGRRHIHTDGAHLLLDNCLLDFHVELELLKEEEAYTSHVASARDGAGLRRQLCQSILHGAAAVVDCHNEVQRDGRAAEVRAGEYIREKREDWIVEGGTLMFQPPHVGSKVEDIQLMDLIAQ